jgi:putative Ig domain-containing protein/glucodextranase-like protein
VSGKRVAICIGNPPEEPNVTNKNLRIGSASTLRAWACVVVTAVAFSLLVPIAAEAATTSITLMWDPNPDNVTIGYSVHYGAQSGNYAGSVDVGNATSAVINLPDSTMTYYFAVQAYSSTGEQSAFSTEVVWTPPAPAPSAQPPTLQNPGSTSTTVGSASVVLKLVATDPAGLALTYSASGLPPGLKIAASTGVISGIPTQIGAYNVTATVTNTAGLSASQTFTWTILALPSTTTPTDGGGTSKGGNGGGNGNGNGGGSNSGGGGNGNGGGGNGNGHGGGNNGGGGDATTIIGGDPTVVVTDPIAGPADPIATPDQTAPDLGITSPTTGTTYRTVNSKIIVTGFASDDGGVVSVTWVNDRGGAGAAFGTTSWATTPIDLRMGDNIITITATDAAGNIRTVTLTVTRYVDYTNTAN